MELAESAMAIQARVRAAPSDGEANAALVRLVAATLRVPKSSVEIVAGHAQRVKQVSIKGDAAILMAALEAIARK